MSSGSHFLLLPVILAESLAMSLSLHFANLSCPAQLCLSHIDTSHTVSIAMPVFILQLFLALLSVFAVALFTTNIEGFF